MNKSTSSNTGVKEDFKANRIEEEKVDVDIKIVSYAPKVFKFIRKID
jgi:hypothetical protein